MSSQSTLVIENYRVTNSTQNEVYKTIYLCIPAVLIPRYVPLYYDEVMLKSIGRTCSTHKGNEKKHETFWFKPQDSGLKRRVISKWICKFMIWPAEGLSSFQGAPFSSEIVITLKSNREFARLGYVLQTNPPFHW